MRKKSIWIFMFIIAGSTVFILNSLFTREKTKPNIVLIIIDALRKDHLSCYGYERSTTASINSLAKKGLLFENDIVQSPWTTASMASIFTSKYPSQVGVGAQEERDSMIRHLGVDSINMLGEEELTLAEVLSEEGYETICITANYLATEKFGLLQGFEEEYFKGITNADEIVDAAITYIEKYVISKSEIKPRPFFLYLHFMETHVPTDPPAPYNKFFSTLDSAPHKKEHYWWEFHDGESLDTIEFKNYRSHKIALYDGGISFIDFEIGRFMDFLESKELNKHLVIAITADHGEEFWDHALFEKKHYTNPRSYYGVDHGHTMFRELLNVPLIFYGTGVPKKRIKQQVRSIDIMPTLLGLAKIKSKANHLEGVDLVRKIRRNNLKDMVAFSEDIAYGLEKKSIQTADFKYISGNGKEKELLFDKLSDPLELNDISELYPQKTESFKMLLNEVLRSFRFKRKMPTLMDERVIKRLRSLGYVK